MKKNKSVDLRQLFCDLQARMEAELRVGKKNISHPTTNGDASELCWTRMLKHYLPSRYCVEKAQVLDSSGNLSQQIDAVIFDQQYSPFLLRHNGAMYVPAESVYAVFEIKPQISVKNIAYAKEKAASVRSLVRTNMRVVHAGGIITEPRPAFRILSGILALGSSWNTGLGTAFRSALGDELDEGSLDIGCCLECGSFDAKYDKSKLSDIAMSNDSDALIFFFLHLVAKLQELGTVPAIDVLAYAKSLDAANGEMSCTKK